MQSPFPGMDPYLEAPDLWPDVHLSLASALRDQLQSQLGTHYVAVLTPYVAFETITIAPARHTVPDVGILERDAPLASGAGTVVAPAPVRGIVAMEMPARYANVEIRTFAGQTLVTAIEILSPVNKRPGRDGADAYDRKRRELLRSEAHLLEIDLLRGGQRPALVTPQPEGSYSILLSRVERRPEVELWPIRLSMRIPQRPVPLHMPDPDIMLDIQTALEQIYRNARYDLRVDYGLPPAPPELSSEDAHWLDQLLIAHGFRAG
jgi:hypothetical protein